MPFFQDTYFSSFPYIGIAIRVHTFHEGVVGATLGSLGVVLGAVFGCCEGGAWCHDSKCFSHSLTPLTQTCVKVASGWEQRARTMSVKMNLGFWCGVDVL